MRAIVLGLIPLVACAPPDPEALFASGEHDVGYRRVETTYTPPGGEARTLPVHAWYPADASGEAMATYTVAAIVERDSEVALAAPAAADGTWPLVVYSHGSGGEGLLGYPYAEHLASHGFVVLAPDHLGNTARDGIGAGFAPLTRLLVDRPSDVRATLDLAQAGAFGGLDVRADQAMVVGHSFGGYTTLAVGGAELDVDALEVGCAQVEDDESCDLLAEGAVNQALRDGFADPRVVALVPQAPAFIPQLEAGSLAALDVPVMLQTGRRDQSTTQSEQAEPAWAGLDGEQDLWVELPDGGHYSFVSICDDLSQTLLDAFLDGADEDGCGDDFTPVSQSVPALGAYLHAFANVHVEGDKRWEDVLVGEALDPAVEVTVP